jgi:hypothetical protein
MPSRGEPIARRVGVTVLLLALLACGGKAGSSDPSSPGAPTSTAAAARVACARDQDCPPDKAVCCLVPGAPPSSQWSAVCQPSCIMNALSFEACTTDTDCKETPGRCTAHQCFGHTYRFCGAITQLCSP